MQELLFPYVVSDQSAFDGFWVKEMELYQNSTVVLVLMKRRDTNGKNYWMVAERLYAPAQNEGGAQGPPRFRQFNAKEFGHAKNRAYRYFEQRGQELAGK